METAKQNTDNLNIFTTHDLLKVLGLKEFDELIFIDRTFVVRDLSSEQSSGEVRLYLLDDTGKETNTFLNLNILVGLPFIVKKH